MSVSPPINWFGGSAAALLSKPPAKIEVYTDIDRELLNRFSILGQPASWQRLKTSCEARLYSRAEFALARQPAAARGDRAPLAVRRRALANRRPARHQ